MINSIDAYLTCYLICFYRLKIAWCVPKTRRLCYLSLAIIWWHARVVQLLWKNALSVELRFKKRYLSMFAAAERLVTIFIIYIIRSMDFKMGSLHWGNTKITFQFKAMLIPNRPMLVVQRGQEVGPILVTGVEGMIATLRLLDHLLITQITTTRISHLKETTLPILPWTTVEKILPILMFRNCKSS